MSPGNPPVHCLHCSTLQDWKNAHWGLGPTSSRVSFVCHQCGWWLDVQARTHEQWLADFAERTAETSA